MSTTVKPKIPRVQQQAKVPQTSAGQRFDQIAAELFPDFSRSRLQAWIKTGEMCIDGLRKKPNAKLAGGETLVLDAELEASEQWLPEPIDFEVVFEDNDIIVIDKPQPLVVHPAAGNWSGTLLNGLIHRYPELMQLPRAGIVHRLDKETSGLMVVARNLMAQANLVEQLQARSVSRCYWAVVQGHVNASDVVDAPIGRHPSVRTKMAVVKSGGKEAITHYKSLQTYTSQFSLLELKLQTGRTHQIRVHMAHIGHPLVGDPTYGKASNDPEGLNFPRQALHAKALGLLHPATEQAINWQVDLPDDFSALVVHIEQGDAE